MGYVLWDTDRARRVDLALDDRRIVEVFAARL